MSTSDHLAQRRVGSGVLALVAADARAHYGDRPRLSILVRSIYNPSLRACWMVRLATSQSRIVRLFARRRLVRTFGIDVSQNAAIGPGLRLPHPVGIVIGDRVRIGAEVTIYQNVTLGLGRGGYPDVGDQAVIYPNSVIVGRVEIGTRATIGANCFVSKTVEAGSTVAGGTRWA